MLEKKVDARARALLGQDGLSQSVQVVALPSEVASVTDLIDALAAPRVAIAGRVASVISQAPRPSVRQDPLSFRLSILVPAYNEAKSIESSVRALLDLQIPPGMFEVIVVDDGSIDGTSLILMRLALEYEPGRLRVLTQLRNGGKGAAVLRAITEAVGTHILIFDADTEYDARDIPRSSGQSWRDAQRSYTVSGFRVRTSASPRSPMLSATVS